MRRRLTAAAPALRRRLYGGGDIKRALVLVRSNTSAAFGGVLARGGQSPPAAVPLSCASARLKMYALSPGGGLFCRRLLSGSPWRPPLRRRRRPRPLPHAVDSPRTPALSVPVHKTPEKARVKMNARRPCFFVCFVSSTSSLPLPVAGASCAARRSRLLALGHATCKGGSARCPQSPPSYVGYAGSRSPHGAPGRKGRCPLRL